MYIIGSEFFLKVTDSTIHLSILNFIIIIMLHTYGTANSQRCTHSHVSLQATPCTGSSNHTRVRKVRFFTREYFLEVCYTRVHSLFSCQARLQHVHARSHLQPLILPLALTRCLYYHQPPICLNPLPYMYGSIITIRHVQDHCRSCTH